jgi:hypothetical protein
VRPQSAAISKEEGEVDDDEEEGGNCLRPQSAAVGDYAMELLHDQQ